MSRSTGVLIVDDSPSYMAVASAVVTATNGFDLVGTAFNEAEAVAEISRLGSGLDLVLLDVTLGDENGVEVAGTLTESRPELKVVFLTTLARDELPRHAERSGADGHVPKGRFGPSVLEAAWAGAYDWAHDSAG